MTKDELIAKLRKLHEEDWRAEENHIEADGALIEYINDDDVKEAYNGLKKWYS